MLIKILRNGLGYIIVFFDWLSRPKSAVRTAQAQANVQAKLQGHSLYQLYACPFCVKTRRALHRLGVNVEVRDINQQTQYRSDLASGGGRVKVPCLRIDSGTESQWLYESSDIISYLEQRVRSDA